MYNKNKACTPEKQLPVIQTLLIKLPVHPSNAQVMIACTLLLLQGFEIAKILFCKYFHIVSHFLSFVFWYTSYFCSNRVLFLRQIYFRLIIFFFLNRPNVLLEYRGEYFIGENYRFSSGQVYWIQTDK